MTILALNYHSAFIVRYFSFFLLLSYPFIRPPLHDFEQLLFQNVHSPEEIFDPHPPSRQALFKWIYLPFMYLDSSIPPLPNQKK